VNLSEEFVSLNSKIGNSLKILERLSKNRDKNILKLRSQREDLYKQLKINRDLIDKALTAFEADTICALESNFDKERGVILEQQSEITSKIADLKHSQHQIESILDIKVESNVQFFLFQNKAKEQMKQNETDIDNMLASLWDISSACTLSTEIDHQSQSVKMLKTLEFQRRICSLDLELEHGSDEDNEITDSSTVEADDILKTPDLNLKLAAATLLASVELLKDVTPQLPSIKLLKDVTPQLPSVKLLKDVTPQLPSVKLLKDVTPQLPSVKLLKDVTSQLPSAKGLLKETTPLKRETLFRYKNHFTFDAMEFKSESLNPFIKVVSSNCVLITGSQNKTMLFFTKSGEAQGEIKLDYPATSAAVIDDKTVAVAAYGTVVFVDTETFKRIDVIPIGDRCIGIAYVKNQLVVNCITRGLIIMDIYGNVAQILKSIARRMQICTLDDKTIVLFKPLSNKVECLDIPTSRKTSYFQIPGKHGAKCVTSDRSGNIFIAVEDEIFLTRPASSNEYSTILSKPYDIIRPLYIDIDIKSHELFVLNNDVKSVYCFQKQMDNV
jgi:Holliday junction resolvase RusA-like endonuclease